MLMTPGGGSAPSLPSPDGQWRGTYGCSAAIGSFGSQTFAFTLDLDLRLVNGSGYWKGNPEPSNGMTIDIRVSVDASTLTLTRSFAGPNFSASNRATLVGKREGNQISATGREEGPGSRTCTLALTRAA